ncbi:winged helix-turn-helix domain-containing protein [Priestia megaterium]|uniref:winged helix-turn-helix domain-containing protein n=1 Tax=Priestia megaterium TaxID=1404 RepID=UPI0037098346
MHPTLHLPNHLLNLTPNDFHLIPLFLPNLQRLYTREHLLHLLSPIHYPPPTPTLHIHIHPLRKKVAQADPYFLQTLYPLAYKPTPPINQSKSP